MEICWKHEGKPQQKHGLHFLAPTTELRKGQAGAFVGNDSIGSVIPNKYWLFGILNRLIQNDLGYRFKKSKSRTRDHRIYPSIHAKRVTKIQDKKNDKWQRISLYERMKADLYSSLFLFVYLTQKSRRKLCLLCTFTKSLMNSKIILSTFKNESMECVKIYKLLQWEGGKWFLKIKILMDDMGSWPTHKRRQY